jgi:hypothetical protein
MRGCATPIKNNLIDARIDFASLQTGQTHGKTMRGFNEADQCRAPQGAAVSVRSLRLLAGPGVSGVVLPPRCFESRGHAVHHWLSIVPSTDRTARILNSMHHNLPRMQDSN